MFCWRLLLVTCHYYIYHTIKWRWNISLIFNYSKTMWFKNTEVEILYFFTKMLHIWIIQKKREQKININRVNEKKVNEQLFNRFTELLCMYTRCLYCLQPERYFEIVISKPMTPYWFWFWPKKTLCAMHVSDVDFSNIKKNIHILCLPWQFKMYFHTCSINIGLYNNTFIRKSGRIRKTIHFFFETLSNLGNCVESR